jgi:hypothetical protein
MDRVVFRHGETEREVVGRVEVKAEDGGLLVLSRDGSLWTVEPQQLVEHKTDETPYAPLNKEELAQSVLAELPRGFDVHSTANYIICHNTSKAYAQWCGALFEKLHRAFLNFWSRKGLDLHDPPMPLVAVVFADKDSYARYVQSELGDAAAPMIGYYSFRTNRIALYDLTGTAGQAAGSRLTEAQINAMLSKPQAERTVATVIHEATHQISFNCGLQTRYADNPLWLSEGLAMYFETPDLSSDKGWRTLGGVNRVRLADLRRYLPSRPADSLSTLLSEDKQTIDAYAESWALTYFLIKKRDKQFVQYLKAISGKGRLIWDKPGQRLEEFQKAFGDLGKLDKEFVRDVGRLR